MYTLNNAEAHEIKSLLPDLSALECSSDMADYREQLGDDTISPETRNNLLSLLDLTSQRSTAINAEYFPDHDKLTLGNSGVAMQADHLNTEGELIGTSHSVELQANLDRIEDVRTGKRSSINQILEGEEGYEQYTVGVEYESLPENERRTIAQNFESPMYTHANKEFGIT